MELSKAAKLARELMDAHGLHDVPFKWSRKVRAFGSCHFTRNRVLGEIKVTAISLSNRRTIECSEEDVRDTILHEIAHALDARENGNIGHGASWKAICRRIGAVPNRVRRKDEMAVAKTVYKYDLVCNCDYHKGKVLANYARKPTRRYVCTRSGQPTKLIQNF